MKALVFAHFDPHDIVDDYVVYALRCYRSQFDTVIFSKVCALSKWETEKVGRHCDLIISRPNIGYDFMSWKVGFEALRIEEFESVTFANDSCYGPLHDAERLMEASSASPAALYGASVNHQFARHVQSFYMTFKSPLLSTGFADQFWKKVRGIGAKTDIILSYEVALSQGVLQSGLAIDGLIEFSNPEDDLRSRVIEDNSVANFIHEDTRKYIEKERSPNPMQLYWGESLRRNVPFVKIELLRDNSLHANLHAVMESVKNYPNYDFHLIYNHLRRVSPNACLLSQSRPHWNDFEA